MTGQLMVIADDQHKAFLKVDAICMFRLKLPESGNEFDSEEVEVTFIGGHVTKLHGEAAKYFIQAAIQLMGGI